MRIIVDGYKSKERTRTMCGKCGTIVDLFPSDIKTKVVLQWQVAVFNCPNCDNRSFVFPYEFTEKLIKELSTEFEEDDTDYGK